MDSKKKVTCVIPARLKSTRLPNKILADIGGKTLLERVWDRANDSNKFDHVVFAIDSNDAKEIIESFEGNFVETDLACPTGTHRLIDLIEKSQLTSDVWVNWQVDEPFISDMMIGDLLQGIHANDDIGIWTLKKSLSHEELQDPNVTKVVTNVRGNALYFSRLPIPLHRDGEIAANPIASKHIGIYAYSDEILKQIATLPDSQLAEAEKLEQLAYLEHGLPVRVFNTLFESLGIDTQEDLNKAITFFEQSKEIKCLK